MLSWARSRPWAVVALVVLVVLPLVCWSVLRAVAPGLLVRHTAPARAFYFDTVRGVLVTADLEFAPILVPGEAGGEPVNEAVWAYVYGCGGCAGDGAEKVGYLETFSGNAKPVLMARALPADGPVEVLDEALAAEGLHRLVALPTVPARWVRADSAEGRRIVASVGGDCPKDRAAVRCEAR